MEDLKSMQQGCIWKSIGAGALGGLAASFAMNQFQAVLSSAKKAVAEGPEGQQESSGGGEDANVKTAEAISEKLGGHKLSEAEKKWAGPAVHYGFGTLMGAVYGALEHSVPEIGLGRGALFGTALWLGADEIAVPAFGLSGPPTETPVSSHLSGLAAHLVYGLVTDLVKRSVVR